MVFLCFLAKMTVISVSPAFDFRPHSQKVSD